MKRFALCLCALLLPVNALADTTGALNGRVVDSRTQAPLANVLVTAVSPSAERTAHTDAHGNFVMLNLPPDTYRVSFTLMWYENNSFSALAIPAGEETHVQVALKREVYLIEEFIGYAFSRLVRPGTAADIYVFENSFPRFGSPMEPFGLLPNVPGITLGNAPRMMR